MTDWRSYKPMCPRCQSREVYLWEDVPTYRSTEIYPTGDLEPGDDAQVLWEDARARDDLKCSECNFEAEPLAFLSHEDVRYRLQEEARETATWRKHRMGVWVELDRHGQGLAARAQCLDCGDYVDVKTKPSHNEANIAGPAVALTCPIN